LPNSHMPTSTTLAWLADAGSRQTRQGSISIGLAPRGARPTSYCKAVTAGPRTGQVSPSGR
jgi:hypothetical protein